jgi:hypothetical protein
MEGPTRAANFNSGVDVLTGNQLQHSSTHTGLRGKSLTRPRFFSRLDGVEWCTRTTAALDPRRKKGRSF